MHILIPSTDDFNQLDRKQRCLWMWVRSGRKEEERLILSNRIKCLYGRNTRKIDLHMNLEIRSSNIDTLCFEEQRLSFNFVLRTGTPDNGCHNGDNDLVMKLQIRSANTGRLWTGAKADKSGNKWQQK